MANIKNFSLNKLPAKPGLGGFSNKSRAGITSISRQMKSTSAFRQFGGTVSHTKNNERSGNIYTGINAAIKNKPDSSSKTVDGKTNPRPNPNFKPKI
ncbi:MAG: hypothetical protein HYT15_03505 [Candidatus Magasanikbacteria bacterium]|nr:hypothetical protein [Candidatus Magasanikbacteria bacterium]